jgi:1-hydroxycarotenoid 3,4-desaturase
MREKHVVVVGAGIAGLVSALLLAHQGVKVTVVDKASQVGGKIRQLHPNGFAVDSGPTVFTMRWVFDEIFSAVNASLDRLLKIASLPVLARHAWDDGSKLDLFADPLASVDAIGQFAGLAEAQNFERFCLKVREVYDTLQAPYIQSTAPSMLQLMGALGPRGLGVLASLGAMSNLWDALGRFFKDDRLRQLFGRYATYCGSSPWQAPATLMLIAQVEMDGVWAIEGGMHALPLCLETLAKQRGAHFILGQACQQINTYAGHVNGVTLENGQTIQADAVVFNGDIAALQTGLLGNAVKRATKPTSSERSLSAVTWSMHVKTHGFALDRHNVFFQNHYASEFDYIFKKQQLPLTPTVYVCAQDRGLDGTPSQEGERLLCLVNAPAVGDKNLLTDEAIEQCQHNSFQLLKRCGLEVQTSTTNTVRTTPAAFHQLFPATGGALYGQATHGWMSAFSRPTAKSQIPGLFLAGGSVHPGPGVPMAAMSGRLAGAAVMAHLNSISRSSRVATSGGMLTH